MGVFSYGCTSFNLNFYVMVLKKKKVIIAGGSGFLGRHLAVYLESVDCEVYCLTRKPTLKNDVYWDGKNLGDWIAELDGAEALINLAGKSVDCRYNEKNKREILLSRTQSTAVLADAVKRVDNPPKVWINSSSATIYVHSESVHMTEDRGVIGDDFSMNICKKWEEEFYKHSLLSTRRVAIRTSIVLGNSGGAYPKLKKLTQLFLGGKHGTGEQFVSWIHIEDFCRGVLFVMNHQELVGSVNVVAPNPIVNRVFMKEMRKSLGRGFGIGQPKWLLEIGAAMIGTETELLLKSRNVYPERLLESGFEFKFSQIRPCLNDLVNSKY